MPFPIGLSVVGKKFANFLQWGIKAKYTGRAIIDSFRTAGIGYRTSTMYSDIRKMSYMVGRWDKLAVLRPGDKVTRGFYVKAETGISKHFATTVRMRGYNAETGELLERNVTFQHDALHGKGYFDDKADEIYERTETSPKAVWLEHDLTRTWST